MSNKLQFTSFDSIQDHVSHVRQVFHTGKKEYMIIRLQQKKSNFLTIGKPRDIKFRKAQLQRLFELVSENEERLLEAMAKDMNKPRMEAVGGDIAPVLDECIYFIEVSD
jgi:acyl-CoA reductase-like NAD-dependent aldehyde dehydrogenase